MFTAIQTNFAGMARLLPEPADILLADLGLSSMQIDNPVQELPTVDGPLDLRMNPHKGQPASALLAESRSIAPVRTSTENADEPDAERSHEQYSTHLQRRPCNSRRLFERRVETTTPVCFKR
jgi:16S rRNA (cytosine1402-N4)-methyltransferase